MPKGYLLDTHALLWSAKDDPQLSERARAAIGSGVPIYLGLASIWEIAIKVAKGKLDLEMALEEFVGVHVTGNMIGLVPIDVLDCRLVATFANDVHRDPFDRMIAAQAMTRQLTLITSDSAFADFRVDALW